MNLKRCPFCGSTDIHFDKSGEFFMCMDCDTFGPANDAVDGRTWNLRPAPWISVSKELPDTGLTVLIANTAWDCPVDTGFFDGGDCWYRACNPSVELDSMDCVGGLNPYMFPPTHWMPLPEPLKTESEDAK